MCFLCVLPVPAVVGENVMLQVATSDMIVGPTRLLFPRAPGGVGEAADFPFSLLGLGDIAIPGEPGFEGGRGREGVGRRATTVGGVEGGGEEGERWGGYGVHRKWGGGGYQGSPC